MRPRIAPTLALVVPLALGAPLSRAPAQPSARPSAPGRGREAVVGDLTALYQRFLDANRTHDTTRYRDLLTADYVYVGGDSGMVLDRAERLRRDAESREQLEVFRVYRCDLRVHGAAAFGPCWYHLEGLSEGERGRWDGVSLVTFLKGDDGRWRIAATRPSASAGPPPPRRAIVR